MLIFIFSLLFFIIGVFAGLVLYALAEKQLILSVYFLKKDIIQTIDEKFQELNHKKKRKNKK